MAPRIGSLPWRRLAPVGVAAALLIPAAPGASAAGPDRPGGQWTAPFEEGGAGVPRCTHRHRVRQAARPFLVQCLNLI